MPVFWVARELLHEKVVMHGAHSRAGCMVYSFIHSSFMYYYYFFFVIKPFTTYMHAINFWFCFCSFLFSFHWLLVLQRTVEHLESCKFSLALLCFYSSCFKLFVHVSLILTLHFPTISFYFGPFPSTALMNFCFLTWIFTLFKYLFLCSTKDGNPLLYISTC